VSLREQRNLRMRKSMSGPAGVGAMALKWLYHCRSGVL